MRVYEAGKLLLLAFVVTIPSILAIPAKGREDWIQRLGGTEFGASFELQARRLLRSPLSPDKFADEAAAGAAFVNAYKASRNQLYFQRAKEIADFLLANANLASSAVPGWGPKLRKGYGFCPDVDNFGGRDLWETTRALDALLKVNEIAPSPVFVATAKKVVDNWPSAEKRLADDGPYASRGMRFYRKEPEPCARQYVKNTNIAMDEVLYRLARQTGDGRYAQLGEQVLDAELWEILTRKNFGYHGAMIYVDPNDPQNQRVLQAELKKVERDTNGNIICRSENPDPSCWNHVAFEAYELYQVQLLSGRDLSEPIWRIMSIYRTSPLGDTQRFPWGEKASPTHITAYNCYLRNSGKAIYADECARALSHGAHSAPIFYSLIPDDLVR